MRNLRTLAAGLTITLLIGACGSNAGASNEPGSSTAASTEPSAAASDGSGDGNGVGLGDGSAKFDLTGAATKSGEFGYLKGMGLMDPDGNQIALTFVDATNSASLTINSGPTGSVVLYADQEIGVVQLPVGTVIGECTVDIDELDSDTARGSFRCEHMAVVQSGEDILGEGTLSGTFTAQD